MPNVLRAQGSPKLPDVNLVFQGGGVRGLAYVGALKVLLPRLKPKRLAGSSAGAIVAALLAAGYSPDELELVMKEDFGRFLDSYWSSIWGLWRHRGIHRGDALLDWIEKKLKLKEKNTFRDLKDGPELRILTADVLNRSVKTYSSTDPACAELSIARVVRKSAGIPFFFRPLDNEVDGGMLSNFPADVFSDLPSPRLPVVGLTLVSEQSASSREPDTLAKFMKSVVGTMLDAHDKLRSRTVHGLSIVRIDTRDIGATDFLLTEGQKAQLLASGRSAAFEWCDRALDPLSKQADQDDVRQLLGQIIAAVEGIPALQSQWQIAGQPVTGLNDETRQQLEMADDLLVAADGRGLIVEQRELARAFLKVAMYWRASGNRRVEISRLQRAVVIDQEYADAWCALGEAYVFRSADLSHEVAREKFFRLAETALEQAERLAGRGPDTAHAFGWLYDEMGNYKNAERIYREGIALLGDTSTDPSLAVALYYNCACALSKHNKLTEALQMLVDLSNMHLALADSSLAKAADDPDLARLASSPSTRQIFQTLVHRYAPSVPVER